MSRKFLNSFAIIDTHGQLTYWDDGFAQEFHFAAPLLKPGVPYAAIVQASSDDPVVGAAAIAGFREVESLILGEPDGSGVDRSGEYRTPEGLVIRFDLHFGPSGIRRFARDVTEERSSGEKLPNRDRQLDATDKAFRTAITETRRTPNGNYVCRPIDEPLQRLADLPPEYVGQDAIMFFARMKNPAEDHARNAAQLEEAALKLKSIELDYHVRGAMDRMRWIRHSMTPRREADGTVIFSGVMRDVTREKEIEDQVEMLRSVVVQSSDSIVIFESDPMDHDGSIVYVNPKFSELFGWSADELTDKPGGFIAGRPVVARKPLAEARLRNDGEPVEFETSSRSGRVFWVEARVVTIQKFDNGRFRWAVMSRDISERRRAQEELLRAKHEAEAANRAKGDFLANMSHELRTPLNAIIGFTDLIKQKVTQTAWTPSCAEYLDDVNRSGWHLLDLINSILDLSQIGAGQLNLDLAPVDLSELIHTSVALVSGLARDGGIAVSVATLPEYPHVRGDYLKLKQVLLNILSNAIKFTPRGGTVCVSLRLTETAALILVEDNGCGIPEADLERVVLPFVQAASSLSRKFEGSGLGLSIARGLCHLHGGALEIDSTEGEGTTVQILLPRSTSLEILPQRSARSAVLLKRR
ncbi:MAG: domain S-box protein [Rhodospirillales bacterium]|nr:domain S-box protein [Rhodospirillales bacterium]